MHGENVSLCLIVPGNRQIITVIIIGQNVPRADLGDGVEAVKAQIDVNILKRQIFNSLI